MIQYELFVANGEVTYYGPNAYAAATPPKYDPITVSEVIEKEVFVAELKGHQQGKTDYPTFIKKYAASGIEKWIVLFDQMTCTYFDTIGNEILQEGIPTVS